MKKMIAIVAVMFVSAMFATTPSSAQTVGNTANYYGVDFTMARAFGAAEGGWEFKEAFMKINNLVVAEWPKYNPGRFFQKNIAVRDIEPTVVVNNSIDPSKVDTFSSGFRLTDEDLAAAVQRYTLKETEGTGLVIIGELMDKSTYLGGFFVVYFDIATREVLYSQRIVGKARGFGLRNYWAGALLSAMKGQYWNRGY